MRQSRDFAAAVKAAGKPVQVIEASNKVEHVQTGPERPPQIHQGRLSSSGDDGIAWQSVWTKLSCGSRDDETCADIMPACAIFAAIEKRPS
jgi:hypothetical protein